MKPHHHAIEGFTLYCHNKESTSWAHHITWNQALNIEQNRNMTFPESVPKWNLNPPLDSWDDSTPKTYIIPRYLHRTNGHKAKKKIYMESHRGK